jgi:hypothetical protein
MKRLPKRLPIAIFLMLFGVLSGNGYAASKGKVDICHIPPGNPNNAHTINVSTSAVKAHLAHGDTLGECPDAVSARGNLYTVCDDRTGEIGRQVTVNLSGRVQSQRLACD